MAKIEKTGKIRIAVKYNQPPFGLLDPAQETPEGFDVSIATMIANDLGIKKAEVQWVEATSDNRELLLDMGDADLVVATYEITEARAEQVNFSVPYFVAGQDLLVRQGNPEKIRSIEKLGKKKVCAVIGSTAEQAALDKKAKVVTADSYPDCVEQLLQKKVAAVTGDDTLLAGIVSQSDGEIEVLGKPFSEKPYGIGIAKGDDALTEYVNSVLEASFADGTWERLRSKTIGSLLPSSGTPAPTVSPQS